MDQIYLLFTFFLLFYLNKIIMLKINSYPFPHKNSIAEKTSILLGILSWFKIFVSLNFLSTGIADFCEFILIF